MFLFTGKQIILPSYTGECWNVYFWNSVYVFFDTNRLVGPSGPVTDCQLTEKQILAI